MTAVEKKFANILAKYSCVVEEGSSDKGKFLLHITEEEGDRGFNVELTVYTRNTEEAASAVFKMLDGLGMNSEAIARGLLRKICRENGLYQDEE